MLSRKFTLNLSVPVEVYADTGVDILMDKHKEVLENDGYDDGRFPFNRELLAMALEKLLKPVVYQSVLAFFDKKYGGETLTDGASTINRARHEADKWMRKEFHGIVVSQESWEATVTKGV